MKLSRAGVWDISFVENSNIIQLFILYQLPWWLASVYCGIMGTFLLPKSTHPSLSVSLFGKELHSSSL